MTKTNVPILSIIDHVEVGALLKQVGTPKRLMILMEGESLLGWPILQMPFFLLLGLQINLPLLSNKFCLRILFSITVASISSKNLYSGIGIP